MKYKVGDEFIELHDPNSGFVIEPVDLNGFEPHHCDYTHESKEDIYYYGTHFYIDPDSPEYDNSTSGCFFSETTLDKYFVLRHPVTEVLYGQKSNR